MNAKNIPPKIVVVGSCNTDLIIRTDRFPAPGETILGGTSIMEPGGKGANQAITAARLGGSVTLVSKIGYDLFGLQAMELYRNENICTKHVITDVSNPTGLAMISVNSLGENYIIVAPGANSTLSPADVAAAEDSIKEADILIVQLEIPLDTVEEAIRIAIKHNVRVVMKPAPAPLSLSDAIISRLFAILPNRVEAEQLSGIEITDNRSAKAAAEVISRRGVENVIITLGGGGVYVKSGDNYASIPAREVDVVDTTGAGDVFCGAFCMQISLGYTIMEAVVYANAAASLSVSRLGAQQSIPRRLEVDMTM
ncbi:MAG: ribokinase [Bacteroides sp.]|nr:ribokinase [Barnesiella sp.]MBD5367709.1 ribokinase [Bacteroides sp.]MBD5427029.1 ribokinase [Treponema sp.]MDE5829375.1 ribokinase [Duncaniella sp.]